MQHALNTRLQSCKKERKKEEQAVSALVTSSLSCYKGSVCKPLALWPLGIQSKDLLINQAVSFYLAHTQTQFLSCSLAGHAD